MKTEEKNQILSTKAQKRLVTLWIILITFIAMTVATTVAIATIYILFRTNTITIEWLEQNGFGVFWTLLPASIIVGLVASFFFSKLIVKPINQGIEGMDSLAKGKYDTRLNLGKNKIVKKISSSFNSLAEELQNTELLRSDFTNNFSHEFKTPIVSIYGFAKLLNDGTVDEEKKKEYLSIIEEESARLASMATNILNLTKIENQNILTNKSSFNLSEQLRTCILILEKQWSQKNLSINADFDEIEYYGEEELLKQVWLNLLDNAVKFANAGSEIECSIVKSKNKVEVAISNYGAPIPEEDANKIFIKFFQTDKSHSSEGNGIGLSIVKKVVELHLGQVGFACFNGKTTFTVSLPTTLKVGK